MPKVIVHRVNNILVPVYDDWGKHIGTRIAYKYYVYGNSQRVDNLLCESMDEAEALKFANKLERLFGAELEVTWAKLMVVEVPVRANSEQDAIDKVVGDDIELRKMARARISG